ncbi:MAG TPA: ferredoxin [Ignavibacteriaceae bacterium]|nr:ferredoxin [Ignavibacteriaceae bacterium]
MNETVEKTICGLQIKIDRTNCIATKNCIKVAPEVFQLDEENISSFVEPVEEVKKENLIEACTVCPVNALYVIDDKGNQLVP